MVKKKKTKTHTQKQKNPPTNAGDVEDAGSISGSGRSPGVGNGNPLQYSCLENFLDRGAWQATAHGVTRSGTRLRIQAHDGPEPTPHHQASPNP